MSNDDTFDEVSLTLAYSWLRETTHTEPYYQQVIALAKVFKRDFVDEDLDRMSLNRLERFIQENRVVGIQYSFSDPRWTIAVGSYEGYDVPTDSQKYTAGTLKEAILSVIAYGAKSDWA